MTHIEYGDWILRAVFNYGLPTVLLLVLMLAAWKGIKAVWLQTCSWVDEGISSLKDFLTGITENDTKRTEALHALTTSGVDGHAKTHGMLHEARSDLQRVEGHVLKIRSRVTDDDE